jgi:hypothetical protein
MIDRLVRVTTARAAISTKRCWAAGTAQSDPNRPTRKPVQARSSYAPCGTTTTSRQVRLGEDATMKITLSGPVDRNTRSMLHALGRPSRVATATMTRLRGYGFWSRVAGLIRPSVGQTVSGLPLASAVRLRGYLEAFNTADESGCRDV